MPKTQEATDAKAVIRDLLAACNELMLEFISRKRAADWAVINDAMVAGERFVNQKRD